MRINHYMLLIMSRLTPWKYMRIALDELDALVMMVLFLFPVNWKNRSIRKTLKNRQGKAL